MTYQLGTYQLNSGTGWICPKCNAVMAPSTPTCFYCKPIEFKNNNYTPIQNSNVFPVYRYTSQCIKCIHDFDYDGIVEDVVFCKKCCFAMDRKKVE